jgi:hypothetical protein
MAYTVPVERHKPPNLNLEPLACFGANAFAPARARAVGCVRETAGKQGASVNTYIHKHTYMCIMGRYRAWGSPLHVLYIVPQ